MGGGGGGGLDGPTGLMSFRRSGLATHSRRAGEGGQKEGGREGEGREEGDAGGPGSPAGPRPRWTMGSLDRFSEAEPRAGSRWVATGGPGGGVDGDPRGCGPWKQVRTRTGHRSHLIDGGGDPRRTNRGEPGPDASCTDTAVPVTRISSRGDGGLAEEEADGHRPGGRTVMELGGRTEAHGRGGPPRRGGVFTLAIPEGAAAP